MNRPGKILGIALGPAGAVIAEVAGSAVGARKIAHLAEFVYPAGVGIDRPAELGKALAAFLRKNHIGERDTVIGLPAKWLITRRKDLPPASAPAAASSLRLQAETDFSSDTQDLVIDYAGEPRAAEPSSVLLIATARAYIDQCLALADAAGLRVRKITATAAALGRATATMPDGNAGDGLVLSLAGKGENGASGGGELLVQHGGTPTHLRYLALPDEPAAMMAPLAGELRRALASVSRNGTPATLAIWDGAGLATDAASLLTERLAIAVTLPELRALATSDRAGAARFAPAVAVALAGLSAESGQIDFLHTRLAPPPAKNNRRKIMWAVVLTATVIVAVVFAVLDLEQQHAEIATLQKRLREQGEDISRAVTARDRLTAARAFYPGSPRFVACLRDLTALFPDDGGLWATALTVHTDLTGQLTAKANSEKQAIDLYDRIRSSPRFADAKLGERRDAGRTGREVTFTIAFTYKPE